MATPTRIVLIHATPVAVDPIKAAFAEGWAEAETVNILDDSLSLDRAREGELSERMRTRIGDLADYAVGIGADGILFTCSAFGSAIDAAASRHDLPVLKPNEAMFEAAIAAGSNIAMIATFGPSQAGMEQEFRDEAERLGRDASLTTHLVEPAMAALKAGDATRHNDLVAAKAAELSGFDAILLAHFSTSRAAPAVRAISATPVLTSPEAAVAKLKRLVAGNAGRPGRRAAG